MKILIKRFFALVVASLFFASPVFAQTATLSLSPPSGTFNKNCSFALEIKLNTGGAETDGTDAIVLYDQSKLTATSISSGSIYPDYPGNNIDEVLGKVTVSGLASVASPFTGSGTLATINFTIKDTAAIGATMVKFDFDPANKAKTTDSNVVQRGTVADILNSVSSGNYTIGAGTCGATPAPTILPRTGGQGAVSTPSGQQVYTTPPSQTLPPAGSEQFTYTIAIVGSVLTILGILGLALL